jgi:hypothetical protein
MATLTVARRQTIWEFGRTLVDGKDLSASSLFVRNALGWVGVGPLVASALVFIAFAAASTLALYAARARHWPRAAR